MIWEFPWVSSQNQVPADSSTLQAVSQSYFWALFQTMLLANWTVQSHNLWTTAAGLTWNTSTAARSWVLLKSPQGFVAGQNGTYLGEQSRLFLCIELVGNSSTDYHKVNFTFYTDPVGGTTTSIPAGGQSHAVNGYQFLYNSLASSLRFNFQYTTTGSVISTINRAGYGITSSLFALVKLTSPGKLAGNDFPFSALMLCTFANTSNYLSGGAFDGTEGQGTVKIFNSDKSFGLARCCILQSMVGTPFIAGSSLDQDGELNVQGLFIFNASPGHFGYIGRVADIYHTEFVPSTYMQIPVDGPKNHYCVNKMLLPGTDIPL